MILESETIEDGLRRLDTTFLNRNEKMEETTVMADQLPAHLLHIFNLSSAGWYVYEAQTYISLSL